MTVRNTIRDSFFGQAVRLVNPAWFPYPEESNDFSYLALYRPSKPSEETSSCGLAPTVTETPHTGCIAVIGQSSCEVSNLNHFHEHATNQSLEDIKEVEHADVQHELPTGHEFGEGEEGQADVEAAVATGLQKQTGAPQVLEDGTYICNWYSDDDPDNPYNWSLAKKCFAVSGVTINTFVNYMAAPIFSPVTSQFMNEYGTDYAYTSLGLALYV